MATVRHCGRRERQNVRMARLTGLQLTLAERASEASRKGVPRTVNQRTGEPAQIPESQSEGNLGDGRLVLTRPTLLPSD